MSQNHAVVIGSAGLIGWGIVNELMSQESIVKGNFNRVTGITNRPIKLQQTFWPDNHIGQPKLLLVDGADLLDEHQDLAAFLKDHILDADTMTHVFYCGS